MAQKPVLRGEVGCACVAREFCAAGENESHTLRDHSCSSTNQVRVLTIKKSNLGWCGGCPRAAQLLRPLRWVKLLEEAPRARGVEVLLGRGGRIVRYGERPRGEMRELLVDQREARLEPRKVRLSRRRREGHEKRTCLHCAAGGNLREGGARQRDVSASPSEVNEWRLLVFDTAAGAWAEKKPQLMRMHDARSRTSSSLDTDLTRNTRAPHFTPQHWLLCHMGLY